MPALPGFPESTGRNALFLAVPGSVDTLNGLATAAAGTLEAEFPAYALLYVFYVFYGPGLALEEFALGPS